MANITFEELKNKYQNKLTLETEVSCKVLIKIKDGYLVNVNEEWEGFIPNTHMLFNNTDNESSLVDTFSALVISGPDKSDRYVVSPRALKEKAVWEKLEKLKEENLPFRVTISRSVKGGAEVFIDGLRAFLPGRYIKLIGISHEKWANQEIDVLIEELDYKEKKIILNHKKAVEMEKRKKAEVVIQKLKTGDIVDAPVLRVTDFGVFVDLGGLDGLVPASELSWGRFNHPREIVKVGQNIKARIFRIEKENLRVALSVKQLLGDPWDQIDTEWSISGFISGKVIGEAPFGLFIELKPGVEALLHNSEIPENIEKPKVGSFITTRIVKMDLDQRKIGLSLRDVDQGKEEDKIEPEKIIQEQTSTLTGLDSNVLHSEGLEVEANTQNLTADNQESKNILGDVEIESEIEKNTNLIVNIENSEAEKTSS